MLVGHGKFFHSWVYISCDRYQLGGSRSHQIDMTLGVANLLSPEVRSIYIFGTYYTQEFKNFDYFCSYIYLEYLQISLACILHPPPSL